MGAGPVLYFDGVDWREQGSPGWPRLSAVWGSSARDVFAVGENVPIVHERPRRGRTARCRTKTGAADLRGARPPFPRLAAARLRRKLPLPHRRTPALSHSRTLAPLTGTALPSLAVPPPGPRSRALAAELARWESPNVTYLADDFPVFWDEARGANVRDVDGNVYVDLTAAFAVAGPGTRTRASWTPSRQAARLLHGMGDVHPPAVKVRAAARAGRGRARRTDRSILASSGAEAVEAALKTAMLATGKPGVLAFHGGYHGLTYGALAVSGREDFRAPFAAQLGSDAVFVALSHATAPPSGATRTRCARPRCGHRARARTPGSAAEAIGAILVEPIQGARRRRGAAGRLSSAACGAAATSAGCC